MIAIISSPNDVHARFVAHELERTGHVTRLINTLEFGRGALIRYPIGSTPEITPVDGDLIGMSDIRTVWYRRPHHGRITLAVRDPDDRHFCRQEWATTFDGLLLNLDARFVNPVQAEFAAVKPRQLHVASEIGIRIPDTLITNDPSRVNAFLDKHAGRVIHKALTAPANRLLDTRQWTEGDRDALAELPLAPTIFQEQIFGPADVRATIVGEDIFAARIATSEGRAGVNSRMDLDARYEPHTLPDHISQLLLNMMAALGLLYGTVDLKITDEGEYVFFEVNPQGQFLYVEILTGLPISHALAKLLASNND